jgi:pyruvate/2-oxoglutarate dehydrogenase complex dihydrolipoamide dehydrogenase (E3) component
MTLEIARPAPVRATSDRRGAAIVALASRAERQRGSVRRLVDVQVAAGWTLADALFFYVGWQLRTELARALDCALRDDGSIVVSTDQATSVDRIYAAGNCADPRALVPTAAGAGVAAAVAINPRMSVEDANRAVASSGALRSAAHGP